MKRSRLSLSLALLAVFALAIGCQKPAAGVAPPQISRAQLAADFTNSLNEVQQQEITFFQAGYVDAGDHRNIQVALRDLATIDRQIHQAVTRGDQSVVTQIQAGLEAVKRLKGALHIKNPESQLALDTIVNAIEVILGQLRIPPAKPSTAEIPVAMILLIEQSVLAALRLYKKVRETHSGLYSDAQLLEMADTTDNQIIDTANREIRALDAAATKGD